MHCLRLGLQDEELAEGFIPGFRVQSLRVEVVLDGVEASQLYEDAEPSYPRP